MTNCPIDCAYCILQTYINNPAITIYTNYDKIISELHAISELNPDRILRIGTGELTDSLALDPITKLSEELIPTIHKLPNIMLELKSKTNNISHLFQHVSNKIVLSWSVNPEDIIKSDELKSCTLENRIKAAISANDKGFLVGFHFDPVIHLSERQPAYNNLINKISQKIKPTQIAWISIGSLRFPPPLKDIAQSRFSKTTIFSGEQIMGKDSKMRYLKPIRIRLYKIIYEELRKKLPGTFIYFCMESADIWEEILKKKMSSNTDIDFYFAEALYKRFPQLNLPEPKKEIYQSPIIFIN
jgi:spore photoproduct lyase